MLRRAELSDLGEICQLREESARWLARAGFDQWNNTGISLGQFSQRVTESIDGGETWVIEQDAHVVSTAAIDSKSDPGLWSKEELRESVIIHRMMTSREYSGRGYGSLLIKLARHIGFRRGKNYVRLDAWSSNESLHRYYEEQGFRLVRVSTNHGTPSGALFEIASADFSEVDSIERALRGE
ncbi:GNAT family N-acetyltransferase [Saccharopolyspora sp. 6V]|uniref:GNAT family N-acetyltransferase n=1 Tax=Saccharopolyspora sp. 6V TaxID=2877239 RepID=UPI001CD1BD66|nr:GNAT family N-acetyltransferase [Saccharopolyspora sp. 6V]MCA1195333.1 GNAT family N-acetyltransferase [Saccharopolyspora sp. 6V]